MKYYSLLMRGDAHENYCEDNLLSEEIGSDFALFAIMDGCTQGEESHFASTLIKKILKKVSKEISYKLFLKEFLIVNNEALLVLVLKALFQELIIIKSQLLLSEFELLSTLVLLIHCKKKNDGVIIVVGDGAVCIDGEITEFENDNIPDYLGYHLAKDFELWYVGQKQKKTYQNASDISISSDGIFQFINIKPTLPQIDPAAYLLIDQQHSEMSKMLHVKLRMLKEKHGLIPNDDLGIIRIMI